MAMHTDEIRMPKLLLKLLAPCHTREAVLTWRRRNTLHLHTARLEHIIRQVHKDGFHVEYIQTLGKQGMETSEIMAAVKHWAKCNSFRVSINQERGIFLFEEG